MNRDQLRLEIAVHEAGHVVIARVLRFPVRGATIRAWHGGGRAWLDADDGSNAAIIVTLAGRAATEVILGRADDFGCSTDDAPARRMLRTKGYVGFGMAIKLYDARLLIREHRRAVEAVANALLARETLTGAEIDLLIGRCRS
jgi:ATP-dependent Zn protease